MFNWEKFQKHVHTGVRVRHLGSEGLLLDTSPYDDMIAALDIADDTGDEAVEMRDDPLFLRYQPEGEQDEEVGFIPIMQFLVGDQWLTADQILALP